MDSKHSQTTPATTSTSSICHLLGAADAQTAHHATFSTAPGAPTAWLRERGNNTSKSTGRSGRHNAATRPNMRREERATVQGPVKEQQPDGMSHRGGGGSPKAACAESHSTYLGGVVPTQWGLSGGGICAAHAPRATFTAGLHVLVRGEGFKWWLGRKSHSFPIRKRVENIDNPAGRGHLVYLHLARRRIGQDGGMFTKVLYPRFAPLGGRFVCGGVNTNPFRVRVFLFLRVLVWETPLCSVPSPAGTRNQELLVCQQGPVGADIGTPGPWGRLHVLILD